MDTQISQRYSKVDLFSVKGRMGRRFYLFYSTLPLIFLWAVFSLTGILNPEKSHNTEALLIFGIVAAIVSLILMYLTIQRCHDFDKSGWFAVFVLIPFSTLIYASVSSINGLNRYGEMPEPAPIYISAANYLIIPLLTISIILSYFL